jgi:hypothetical protein
MNRKASNYAIFSVSNYFFPIWSKYIPQHPVLEHPLNLTDHVSQPYKTAGKIVVPHILLFIILESKRKYKDPGPNGSRHSLNLTAFKFFVHAILTL